MAALEGQANPDNPDEKRLLLQKDIDSIVTVKVEESEEDSEAGEDKDIASIVVDKVEDRSITLKVVFNQPTDITTNIMEPDKLVIQFTDPEAIIDAQTGQPLEPQNREFFLFLQPQYSEAGF